MIFPFRNVRDVLGLHAKVSPHKNSVIFYDAKQQRHELSYLEFVGKAHQIANFLYEDLGINRGDSIALASPNTENALLLCFATWVIGASVHILNESDDESAISTALSDSNARVLFVNYDLLDKFAVLAKSITSIEGVIQIGGKQRDDFLRLEDCAANRPTTFLGDESGAKGADIPVTGGNERTARLSDVALSTTYHDGVAIRQTQGDLLQNANRLSGATALTGNQTTIATLPFHDNFVASLMTPLLTGATVVLSETFSADLFWHMVVRERAHTAVLNSENLAELVETAREHIIAGEMRFGGKIIQQDVKHFRHILTTDTDLTVEIACDFEDTFGMPLITAYQPPQTSELLTLLPITLSWSHHQYWLHGNDNPSIGVPLTDLAIVDENGNRLKENEIGRLAISGENGYLETGHSGYFRVDETGTYFYFLSLKS